MNMRNKFIHNTPLLSLVLAATIIFTITYIATKGAHEQKLAPKVATCTEGETKTFKNHYVSFEYPCNWHFTSQDITNSNQFKLLKNDGDYIGFLSMQEEEYPNDASKIKNFATCDDNYGPFYDKKLLVKNHDGALLEACHHAEHGGETLLIKLDNGQYLNITFQDGGLINIIIPSLIVN